MGSPPVPRLPWHVTFVDRHGRAIDVRLFERDGTEVTYGPDERLASTVLDGYGVLGERTVRVVRRRALASQS